MTLEQMATKMITREMERKRFEKVFGSVFTYDEAMEIVEKVRITSEENKKDGEND